MYANITWAADGMAHEIMTTRSYNKWNYDCPNYDCAEI